MRNLRSICLSLPSEFEEELGRKKQYGTVVKRLGYIQSQANHTFYKHSTNSKIAILFVYMDDIILIGDDSLVLKRFEGETCQSFQNQGTWLIKILPI
ncbi:hypothetical protein CR513_03404, partial [Mucuna pruriens]